MSSMLNPEQIKINENLKYKLKVSDPKEIARMMVLKYIMTSDLYGVKTFIAFYQKFHREKKEPQEEIKFLGKLFLKYDGIRFFDEITKKTNEFSIKNIKEYAVYPDYVEIGFSEIEKSEWVYRFYSAESIVIYRALELYVQIEKLTGSLNEKYVKKLKQQQN